MRDVFVPFFYFFGYLFGFMMIIAYLCRTNDHLFYEEETTFTIVPDVGTNGNGPEI